MVEFNKSEGYHYTECGLDYIYLLNGYNKIDTPYGEAVSIDNSDALHRAIGWLIVNHIPKITGQEVRFIRSEMNFSQKQLATLLDVGESTVARWEQGGSVPNIAGRVIRLIYKDFISSQHEGMLQVFKEEVEKPRSKKQYNPVYLSESSQGWQQNAA